MDKKISYLARTFDDVKSELISFSKKYYPELSDNYNDASVGAWFIDLVSAVSDDLSYHTDRVYQETNINSTNSKSSVLNMARMNGVKIPGPKASVCEVELSCVLPKVKEGNISNPNWGVAPTVRRGTLVGNSSYAFELTEDVNFGEQFNSNGYSNRKFIPLRDTNGVITGYQVTKSVIAISGKSKVYKKVLGENDVTPFMEIVLPEKNIMNVESIIFKENPNFNVDPKIYEYYIDEEEFRLSNESVVTYRYFEVDSLADQYRFGDATNFDENGLTVDPAKQVGYIIDEENEDGQLIPLRRYYEGKWKPISQKFITEYTDNGYLKVIFGCATDIEDTPMSASTYGENIMSKIINNKMLGLLPKIGWTMFVLYRVGGGASSNLAQGAINTILNADVVFPDGMETSVKTELMQSLSVTNVSPSLAGKDAPSVEEMKYLVKYSIPSQERCVTLKDYKARIMMMPPRYGAPFRCNVAEENNKIVVPMLCLNSKGQLTPQVPQILVDNIKEYMFNYKNLTDYIEMKSGRAYNIGFALDIFVDKNYTTADVIASVINTIKNYMDVSNHVMGEDIFMGDLERIINGLDGVISLIDLRIYSLYGGDYSQYPCPLPFKEIENPCAVGYVDDFEGGKRIDLEQIDGVLYCDFDSMYEVKNPESDIKIRVKLR